MQLLRLLSVQGLAPHGFCLLWDPVLLWLHVISDAVIGLSYFSIPIALLVFLARRRDVEFGWMIGLFVAFITACGTTHFLAILVLWIPAYGLEGVVKALTAVVSMATAVVIWPLLPRLLALPHPRQLQLANDALVLEAAERSRVEDQLRQSQKLEAIGQLTGGIAHDFNNILTVIMGSIERATTVGDPGKAGTALHNAMEACKRAELLTSQLLSFARKQPMEIAAHDLNAIVRDFISLITVSVGADIQLVVDLAAEPLPVAVDRNQLETALFNLVFNARDAMPGGGIVRVTTLATAPGEVAVRVADHGAGMDSATVARATEPFFTTKAVGLGTGLGLSQVFGFAQQAGGTLAIVSSPGQGTSVTIALHRQSETN